MTDEYIDPFDLLAANDPARDLVVDPYDETADRILANAMRSNVVETDGARRRQGRRLLLIAAAVLLALLATAMVWLQRERQPTTLGIICYAEVGLDGHRSGVVADGAPDASDCTGPWKRGDITNPSVPAGHVPPLTACVTDLGALAVFPTDNAGTCEELGLASPLPPSNEVELFSQALDEMVDLVLAEACFPVEDALVEFRAILDRYGLEEWTLEIAPARPHERCASIAYETENQRVLIVRVDPAP